ncbi:hypothetical protein [Ornithinimicrobium kibberense]|uniref:hypothetical protein n=1 Tax=Ornithinimicrobium kibberense TaxID=282060 RepID=UPI00361E0022
MQVGSCPPSVRIIREPPWLIGTVVSPVTVMVSSIMFCATRTVWVVPQTTATSDRTDRTRPTKNMILPALVIPLLRRGRDWPGPYGLGAVLTGPTVCPAAHLAQADVHRAALSAGS